MLLYANGQAKRAAALYKMNPAAVRPFYYYLPRFAPLEASTLPSVRSGAGERGDHSALTVQRSLPALRSCANAVVHFWEHVYTTAHAGLTGAAAESAENPLSPQLWLEIAALLWETCQAGLAKDKKLSKARGMAGPAAAAYRARALTRPERSIPAFSRGQACLAVFTAYPLDKLADAAATSASVQSSTLVLARRQAPELLPTLTQQCLQQLAQARRVSTGKRERVGSLTCAPASSGGGAPHRARPAAPTRSSTSARWCRRCRAGAS